MKIKKDKLKYLLELEFEYFWDFPCEVYQKTLSVGYIEIKNRFFSYKICQTFWDDFFYDITRLSKQLTEDRNEINIIIDILREKEMLEDE